MEIDAVPAHDSPKNILNILDVDCIEQILQRLPYQRDVLKAAKTCKRFLEAAKRLKSVFKSIVIGEEDTLPQRVPMVLSNFGHLIEEIEWCVGRSWFEQNIQKSRNDEIFKSIVKYCGKTLKKLEIQNYNPTFNEQNRFQALECLTLENATPCDFRLDSPLKYLAIKVGSWPTQPCLMKPFPNLVAAHFNYISHLTDDFLAEFLSLCPQLTSLKVEFCNDVSPMILKSIASHSHNLERLVICRREFDQYSSSVLNEQLQHLKVLRKLRQFEMNAKVSLEPLMIMFAENHIPIECLDVEVLSTDGAFVLPINNKLKDFNMYIPPGSSIPDDFFIDLVKSLPALKNLTITDRNAITRTRRIENILKYGESLAKLDYNSLGTGIGMSLDSYNRLLSLAKNRVRVELNFNDCEVGVPDDVLEANSEWLDIELYGLDLNTSDSSDD